MFTDVTTLDVILRGIILAAIGLAWVVIAIRIIGLRAFSKMTAFDFVVTVATGSLLAGAAQASDWPAFWQSLVAVAALLTVQATLARTRRHSDAVKGALENEPMLLMRDGTFHEAALTETRVAKSDVIAKLREANVLDFKDVRAVVLETTGDISVLHGETLNPALIDGVRTRN